MFINSFVLLGTFWYMLQSTTWLLHALGYVFGLLLASWSFDRFFAVK